MRSAASRTLRALPTLFRIGVAETVAYRAEFIVWMLTSTMPLINLALWKSVADEGPFEQYKSDDFVAYFLCVLIVRQLSGNWVAWQMSEEIRNGTLAMRMLRPLHPFVAYATSHAAALPFRSLVAVPIAVILLLSTGAHSLTTDPLQLALIAPSILLAWLLSFAILFTIGALGFWITQTMALGGMYFGLYFVLSGYSVPLDLMKPASVRAIAMYTPFRYMLSASVDLMMKPLGHQQALELIAGQVVWTAACAAISILVWRAGVRRFEAVGA
jgi:ABC-2 type transport system permease protein